MIFVYIDYMQTHTLSAKEYLMNDENVTDIKNVSFFSFVLLEWDKVERKERSQCTRTHRRSLWWGEAVERSWWHITRFRGSKELVVFRREEKSGWFQCCSSCSLIVTWPCSTLERRKWENMSLWVRCRSSAEQLKKRRNGRRTREKEEQKNSDAFFPKK